MNKMDKFYLFLGNVLQAVKVSMAMTITLLLIAFSEVAVGHENVYTPTGATAPTMLPPSDASVGFGGTYTSLTGTGGLFDALNPGITDNNVNVSNYGSLISGKSGIRINKPAPEPKPLTIISVDAEKVYNGTTTYTFNAEDLDNVVLGGLDLDDHVTIKTLTGTFANKFAGDDKTFTITGFTLEGNVDNEYTLSQESIKADIKPIELEVKGISVDASKVYDGTVNAVLNYSAAYLSGTMIPADNVTLKKVVPKAEYNTKDVGVGKAVIVSGLMIDVLNEDNYIIKNSSLTLTANITKRPLTITASCLDKVYDATETAVVTLSDNRILNDLLTLGYSAASFETDDAGANIPVSVEGITVSGIDAGNYSFNETAATTATISPKVLTVSGVSVEDKIYDGDNKAVLSGSGILHEVLGTDEVTLVPGIATFSDKSAGDDKVVTFSGFRLEGSDKENYTLTQPPTVLAEIEQRPLLIKATSSERDYNASTTASVTLSDALSENPRVAGDVFDIHFVSANFADPNAGVDKAITVTGISIEGADAANYTWNTEAITNATIKPIYLTIADVTAENKVYDGTTTAELDMDEANLVGVMYESDHVSLNKDNAVGQFDNKNVGNDKPVTIAGFEITDLNANKTNYIITQPSGQASVLAKELSLEVVGVNKEYDGKTDATVTITTDDNIAGETLTFSYDADFSDKNVGVHPVNVQVIAITGDYAGNYALEATTASTSAEITQKELSVVAEAKSRIYDGDDDAEVILTPDPEDVAEGDVLTLHFTEAHFSDKNVGVHKTVTIEGLTIFSGNEAGNYFLDDATTTAFADITQKNLTVDADVTDKVYNGNTDVVANTVTLASPDKIEGDDLGYSFGTATFSDKNVGDRTVLVEGIAINGVDAANYSLQNATSTTDAKITPKDLSIVAHGVDKIYDRSLNAKVTFVTTDLVGDDEMEYDYTANFSDKNVDEEGDAIPITVTAITLKGDDALNYHLITPTANTEAHITPATLEIKGVTAKDKLYNTNKVVDLDVSHAELVDLVHPELNLIALDNVVLIKDLAIGEFATKDAGENMPVIVTGFRIDGDPNEYNYSLVQPSVTANITKVNLRITGVTAADKPYDGTTNATLTGAPVLEGVLTGDVVTLAGTPVGTFKDKNVHNDQIVTTSGYELAGADAGNYTLTFPLTYADIDQLDLTLTADGIDKIYDGNTAAEVEFGNWIEGDNLSVTYTAAFDNKNVNNDIPISVTGIEIHGDNATNYHLTSTTATTDANITPRDLRINGVSAENKVYDRSVAATLVLGNATLDEGTDAGDLIPGDIVTINSTGASGSFDNWNVGTAKTVTTTGFDIEGADEDNYTLIQPSTKANITPAPLTIEHVVANNKTYDGTDVASLNVDLADLDGVFDPDEVELNTDGATGVFVDKNAGLNKNVALNGFTIEGEQASNYTLTQPDPVMANILQRRLMISANVDNKEYDGTDNATISVPNGLVMSNNVSTDDVKPLYESAQARFEDKNADYDDKEVYVTGITIGGVDAANYIFNTDTITSAIIATATLKVNGVTANNKTYDGTNLAQLDGVATATLEGIKGNDQVILDRYVPTSVNFSDKNVGTDLPVIITGKLFDIEGADVLNYMLDPLSLKANITGAELNITGVTRPK